MRQIPLTQGKVALVDDEDYEYLNQFSWNILNVKGKYYARRGININGKVKSVMMHRMIMNTPDGMVVDHIDHNGLNCQKSNMRNCTCAQNLKNGSVYGKSIYHGVSFFKSGRKIYIKAAIQCDGRYIYLGIYKNEEDAAKAYDSAAKKHFGKFANLNFKTA